LKYLFVDSATATLVVAIVIDDKIKYIFNDKTGKDMSSVVMPKIKEAFDTCNIGPRDIDKIFVVTGPGSFTGIRVGLTVVKVMAWTLKIPVVPISSLEVIASGTPSDSNVALIDARRGYVFAGEYNKRLNNTSPDRYMLLSEIKGGTFISYDDIEGAIKPNINILKVIHKHEKNKGVNPHKINPNYLKLTEAEEKLNDRRVKK